MENNQSHIESEFEVKAFISDLKYAINNGATIEFQIRRNVDDNRDQHYTNQYTVSTLFPNENPIDALRRELLLLTEENYIKSVKDLRFPNRGDMREFGKVYNNDQDVYIKVRVELLGQMGAGKTFVMSFHFAEKNFTSNMFPYKKDR